LFRFELPYIFDAYIINRYFSRANGHACHRQRGNLVKQKKSAAQELRLVPPKDHLQKEDVPMIYIKEADLHKNITTIEVDGILDDASIPVLKKVCDHHLACGKSVALNLKGIIHITREGRIYLQAIKDDVFIAHLPDFVSIDHS
jgi:hypothetical protein